MRETNDRRAEIFRQRRCGEFESDGERIRKNGDTIERVGVGLPKRPGNVRTFSRNGKIERLVTNRIEYVGNFENEECEFAREKIGITKTTFKARLSRRFVGSGARESTEVYSVAFRCWY